MSGQQVEYCASPFHPEWHDMPCGCMSCNPVGYCVEDPCLDCPGPQAEQCEPPDEDDSAPEVCRICGTELQLTPGWMPSYSDPDNRAMAEPAEPFCSKCKKDKQA